MADDNVFTNACQFALDTFGFPTFKESEKDCLRELISGRDVLVLQPTGSRENPSCFSLFPLVCDYFSSQDKPQIVLVISPLVKKLNNSMMTTQTWLIDRAPSRGGGSERHSNG